MQRHVLMCSIGKPNTSRGLFTRIFVATLVCSIVGACSSAVSPVSGTLSSNQAKNRPFATQDIQTYPLPVADNSGVYPVPQSRVTFVPFPAIPTEKPTPYTTPTPVVHWNSDAIEVSWNSYSTVGQPEWLNNTIAKLAVYSAGFSDGYVTVDISKGKEAKAKVASVHSDLKSYSPKRNYVIECTSVMNMYGANNDQLISIAPEVSRPPTNNNCSRFIHWSPDETAASFIDANHDVYVWPSDGIGPRKVVEHVFTYGGIAWSPDSQKLAVERSETASHIGTINVIDVNGELLDEFQIQAGGDGGAILGWLSNDVWIGYSRYTNNFYDVTTGNFLFNWTNMPTGDGVNHQPPQVSPNGRWVFIDQGNEKRESTFNPNHYIVRKEYSLYDIQSKKSVLLIDDWGNYLGYAGWNADASTIYLISRPAESVSNSNPSTPFGLFGYNVQTHQFEQLFKEAVQVTWNTDKSWAFVVFPVRGGGAQVELAGGLWKFGSKSLIGRWLVSDQIVYQDPVLDTLARAFPDQSQ